MDKSRQEMFYQFSLYSLKFESEIAVKSDKQYFLIYTEQKKKGIILVM